MAALDSQSGSLVSVRSGVNVIHWAGAERSQPPASADREGRGGALGPWQSVLSPQLCRADLTSGQHGEIHSDVGWSSSGVESSAAI